MSIAIVKVEPVIEKSKLNEFDLEIIGEYDISLVEGVTVKQAADIALDVFHANVAVKCLDDFTISVVFEGKVIEGDPDHEAYTFEHLGSM